MGTLGNYLRNAREALGLDIREAAQQTRISLAFLTAIEAEEFSKLPGEVFVKGFLKNYARFLRLSEDEVMKRYAELRSSAAPAAAAAAAAAPAPLKEERRERPQQVRPQPQAVQEAASAGTSARNPEPYVWGGALFLALILFIVVARPSKHAVREQPLPVTAVTPNAALVSGPAATMNQDKIYLDMEALEDTWVLVRTDSSPQKNAVLRKGESITWSANERFLLSYGRVGAVRLLLNGKELSVAGARNAVVRDLLVTAKGIAQQKTEGEQPPRKPKPQTPSAACTSSRKNRTRFSAEAFW